MGIFAAPNAPNLHDVAEAVAKLVATPKGHMSWRLGIAGSRRVFIFYFPYLDLF